MVESELGMVPEGGAVKEMREVADVIDCLHSKKPLEFKGGTKTLLQLFNIADCGKLDLSKRFFISDDDYLLWTNRIETFCGDCIVTNVGRIAAVAQIPKGEKVGLGRNMTAIRPKTGIMTPTYLIEYLLSPHMDNEVQKKKDAGTIMDFPFGQPKTLMDDLELPPSWKEYVGVIDKWGKEKFEAKINEYCDQNPDGKKYQFRDTDRIAKSSSPMNITNPPVGKMFFQGAPRLLNLVLAFSHAIRMEVKGSQLKHIQNSLSRN